MNRFRCMDNDALLFILNPCRGNEQAFWSYQIKFWREKEKSFTDSFYINDLQLHMIFFMTCF